MIPTLQIAKNKIALAIKFSLTHHKLLLLQAVVMDANNVILLQTIAVHANLIIYTTIKIINAIVQLTR